MISGRHIDRKRRLRPIARRAPADPSMALPRYELRCHYFGPADTEMEIWQLPSPATPAITAPLRVAGCADVILNWLNIALRADSNKPGVPFEQPALTPAPRLVVARRYGAHARLALSLSCSMRKSRQSPQRRRRLLSNMGKEKPPTGLECHAPEEPASGAVRIAILLTPVKTAPSPQH